MWRIHVKTLILLAWHSFQSSKHIWTRRLNCSRLSVALEICTLPRWFKGRIDFDITKVSKMCNWPQHTILQGRLIDSLVYTTRPRSLVVIRMYARTKKITLAASNYNNAEHEALKGILAYLKNQGCSSPAIRLLPRIC